MTLSTILIAGAWFVGGAILWTLMEWVIHNFLGHHGSGKNPFAVEHVRHHATTHYFAPAWKKIGVAVLVTAAIWSPLSMVLSALNSGAFTVGFVLMYGMYELAHRRSHTHPPRGAYSRWIRLHHYYHHFRNPHKNHGVTTPFWDMVFGSYESVKGPIRIPEKHALAWLVNPETGEMYEKYAGDYIVFKRGQKKSTEDSPPAALKT